MRRTTAITAPAVILILAGCGVIPGIGPDPRIDAIVVDTLTCPETFENGYAEAGLVPASFSPVAVLRCDPYASQEQADGVWAGALLERLEGDLAPVLAALASPSDPRSLGACPAIGYLSPELWLEGADGRFVRVAVPTGGCGAPKDAGVDEALDALIVAASTFTPTALVESTAANEAGCAAQADVLILAGLDAVPDSDSADGVDVPGSTAIASERPGWPDADAVTGAILCDYALGGAWATSPALRDDAARVFVGARELSAADTRAVIADAVRAPTAAACTEIATRLVVVQPSVDGTNAATFTVELDGCRRLVDPIFRARTASPELLQLLSPKS